MNEQPETDDHSAVDRVAKRILDEANRRKAEIDREAAAALFALVRHRMVEPQQVEWISLEQAAHLRGVTRQTMARQAKQFSLGTCINGRWRIDKTRVLNLNNHGPAALREASVPDDEIG